MHSLDDVIAAIATPAGEGGIAVLRVSGRGAIGVVDGAFRGRHLLETAATHTAHVGTFIDATGRAIDEVVATLFREPHSYTGENTVEISCHGGLFVSREILTELLSRGARHAEPGEFTKRAFLNGRIDLSQAEAVADLIQARSEAARKLSFDQLRGRLSHKLDELKAMLVSITGALEIELDFAEEGLAEVPREQLLADIAGVSGEIGRMIGSYRQGRVERDGAKVVLVGDPNVGKSSILNSLLDKERSIVTHLPGTTRDTIEESVTINGMLFRLVDTAGLRESDDLAESEGIRRTRAEMESADLVLQVSDCSRAAISAPVPGAMRVLNKFDLVGFDRSTLPTEGEAIVISAKSGYGIDELKSKIFERCSHPDENVTLSNARHLRCLQDAQQSLANALASAEGGMSGEFVVVDLRGAMHALEMIIGVVTTDEILQNVFANFCIGK
jgi:tRNA modification GTPase